MRSAFSKGVRRSITGSWGRFLAIAGIVALGCGFYAGLRMTAPDMRLAADGFYDGTELYDIRLLSSLGFSDSSVDTIADTQGVESVMAGYSTDVMATLSGEQYAIRVSSLPAAAASSDTSNGRDAISDDASYLNRPILMEGSWPVRAGECVLSDDRVMSTPIQIGDTVEVLYGSKDLDGVLDTRTFTVVGLVRSSTYVSSVSLGSTSLGSGVIQQYMYVSPDNFSADCPYTEVYVKVAGADAQESGTDAYQSVVDPVMDRFDALASSLAADRYREVHDDAQSQLDDKKTEFEDEKASANAELDDARTQLDDAAQTIADTRATLDSAAEQIASGQEQIDEARDQWNSGYAEWESAAADWRTQRADLAGKLESARTQRDTLTSQLADTQAQRDALALQLADAQSQLDTLTAQAAGIEAQIAALDPADPAYADTKAALEATLQQVQAGIAQAQGGVDQLSAGIAQIDDGIAQLKSGIAQAEAGIAQLEAGISSGDDQVASAKATLDAGAAEIESNQATLDESRAEMEDGLAQLEAGEDEYDENLVSYQDARAKADSSFADAEKEIADAQADIDAIEHPTIYILDRTRNFGVASFDSDAGRVDNIAAVFPFIFFLVAALVALTTMTRMVDEERIEIGTYKALGYSKGRIASKYLIYAATASVSGAVIGILVLSQVLPAVICKAYAIIYNVPQHPFPLVYDVPIALMSAGMGIGITLIATLVAVAAELREQPATLMLPRAPKAGKRILLERITPLWRRVSFTWKVTFRNIFRYRRRLWMTVIGIAGCTALLLTGLGLHDAIWDIIDNQFEGIVHYQVIVGLTDDSTEDEVTAAMDYMAESGDAKDMTRAQCENMQVGSRTKDPLGVQVVIPDDTQAFSQLVTMRERVSGASVALDDDSVLLTEKLAKTLGVSVGDTFTLYDQDEVGNAVGDGYELTVTGIVENYVGNYLYLGKDIYTRSTGVTPAFTSVYATCTTDTAKREAFTQGMHDMDAVETVTYNDETIDSYRKMLSSVNMIVVVLVVAAAALAFIVLYNLTNINITERRREIASLKVLGFTKREVDSYIYREISLLTVLGALIGLVLGVFMEAFVVVTAEVDQVMFGRAIHAVSFLGAFGLTIVFMILVMLFMRRKLAGIDMVESLKSVD